MTNPTPLDPTAHAASGILLVNKPKNKTSFGLVAVLRRLLNVKKIGHAGTLDPFATGVMIMLIGRNYTRLSDTFLGADKEYLATAYLGVETDTFDCDGVTVSQSDIIPTLEQIENALKKFQGEILQTPPMFSAKKINGKKLYDLARKGIVVERQPVLIKVQTQLISYQYPYLELRIQCSKGTYIRSIAHDLGSMLDCGAHLTALQRTRSGTYALESCIDGEALFDRTNCNVEALKSSLIKL